jgi:geranylgeranyl diphosphate synthase type II
MYNPYLSEIEKSLLRYLPEEEGLEKSVIGAMRYSLMDGGKRIRPTLTIEFCRVCGGDLDMALPFACAVEMVHTYSLIHDDLPCMDDDDMRRGRPSNHIVNGEDIALLAGDALLSLAFETMLSEDAVAAVGASSAIKAAHLLAKASGAHGMVGGQVIDLENEGKQVTVELLKQMDDKKTGALITAAAEIGCIAAGASEEKCRAAATYAEAVGLAFQIVDDILDVTAKTSDLGKPAGSDLANQKSTYVSIMGLEKSRELVRQLTEHAVNCLRVFGEDTAFLRELALYLAERKN